MEELCPNCGKSLTSKTITKKRQGVIEYLLAKICQKCGWKRDQTGDGVIVRDSILKRDDEPEKPLVTISQIGVKNESGSMSSINQIIVLALIVFVIGGLAFAFFPQVREQPLFYQDPVPGIIQNPMATTAETSIQEDIVIPTGKKWPILLDYKRGFVRNNDLTIKLGDEVVWDNVNTVPVTLVSEDNLFEKILLDYGKHASFMITKPGKYVFYLEKNRNMTGTITVIKP